MSGGGNFNLQGGAIWTQSATVELSGVELDENEASSYGGAIFDQYGELTLSDCSLVDNASNVYGGGIYSYYGNTAFSDCDVQGNTSGLGGGVFANGSTLSADGGDWGDGSDDNDPDDVYLYGIGAYVDFGSAVGFVCSSTSCE